MIDSLKKKISLMERELKRRGVIAIILYGSVASKMTHPMSDVDIAVLMKDGKDVEWLYQELQKAVRRDVDLVVLNEAPPRIKFSALKGVPLYVSDEREFVRFKARVYDEWADLEPLRKVLWRYTRRWLDEG